MNIAMNAKTKDEAFIQALTYYQKRLSLIENNYQALQGKVLGFVELFVKEVEYGSSSDIPSHVLEIDI
jgi:hypothetical protein